MFASFTCSSAVSPGFVVASAPRGRFPAENGSNFAGAAASRPPGSSVRLPPICLILKGKTSREEKVTFPLCFGRAFVRARI